MDFTAVLYQFLPERELLLEVEGRLRVDPRGETPPLWDPAEAVAALLTRSRSMSFVKPGTPA